MNGSIQSFFVGEKQCHVYSFHKPNMDSVDTVYVLDGDQFETRLEEIETYIDLDSCRPFRLVFFDPVDWNREYSPWPAQAVFRNGETFSGQADRTLSFLSEQLIPEVQKRYSTCNSPHHRGVIGYSLGGLCALWLLHSSNLFGYGAACSPSVWYEGWLDFAKQNPFSNKVRLYLSLGKKEEKTRNSQMSHVGDVMRSLEVLYQNSPNVSKLFLEWNEGGHFQDVSLRIAKGLQWILS